MLVYSNTDEADVGRIRDGAPASFRVDAYPRETFNGRIYQQRMNATTIQNVVTYNTTIAFDNPDLRLFPGMTAYASIPVATATNVVKIPNGALRFKPDLTDSQRKTLYAKYNITESTPGAPARMAAATSSASTDNAAAQGAAATPAAGAANSSAPAQGAQGGAARGGPGRGGAGGGGQNGGGGGRAGRAASQREDTGIVWKLLPDKTLMPVQVRLGVTDFTFTAMTKGDLKPGDRLVIGQATGTTTAQNQARSPLGAAGGPPGVPRRF
jgi:HlyD family secretion protein